MARKKQSSSYFSELQDGFSSIESSRSLYSSIRAANKVLRAVEDSKNGNAWSCEKAGGSSWAKLKAIEGLEIISFEMLLALKKMLYGFAVLIGWLMLLGFVVLWLGGFR